LTDITVAAVPHCILPAEHRSRVVQPSTQLHFTENRARKRNWSDRIIDSADGITLH